MIKSNYQEKLSKKKRRKHHFGPYILGLQLIWFLHFGNNQFGSCYFQLTFNLVITVNLLTENGYMANGGNVWQI